MRSAYKLGVMVFLLAGVFVNRVNAQGGATGAISGSVIDTSGSAVSGAEVQIISGATQALARRVTVNADGEFVAPLYTDRKNEKLFM